VILRNLASRYEYFHRYDAALEASAKRLKADPSAAFSYFELAALHLRRGELREARSAISEMFARGGKEPYHFIPGQVECVVRRILTVEEREVALEAFLAFMDEVYPDDSCVSSPGMQCLRKAIHEEEVGSKEKAKVYWDSLATWAEERLEQKSDLLKAAVVFEGLGRKDLAIEAAETMIAIAEDEEWRNHRSVFLARLLTHFGEHERAIEILQEELPAPSVISVPLLEIDPIWDPLRDHPRFQALLERYRDDVEH
jgi:tetratricopeptide (TPR) repeat protein